MDKEKIKNAIDDVGRKADNIVSGFAAFHNFEKWQIWLCIAVIVLIVLIAL